MTDRAADVLAKELYSAGCRYAFGMPGGEVLTLVDALERAGIRFILTKHENAAGFMAEGIWQRTGAPGILVATVGPGVANAINVIANAEQDRVPMLFLTGCVDEADALTYTHQVFDHQQLLRPITRASYRLTAEACDVVAVKAIRAATGERPGPVHVDVPISVATAAAAPLGHTPPPVASPVGPVGQALEEAEAAIAAAERPLIIAGLEALDNDGPACLAELSDKLSAPIVTTYKAKGIVPEDRPYALGGAGLSPIADRLILPLVAAADVIVAAGYDPIEMRTGWRQPWDPIRQTVIEITAHANDHDMHAATMTFVGDVAAGLTALTPAAPLTDTWPDGAPARTRAALADAFTLPNDPKSATGDAPGWGPSAVIATARATCPPDTIATVDSGAHRILLSQMWQCSAPRTLLQSTGLCTMGCAIPLAAGAKLAEPERPVVAFTGDAGALMVLGELATLAELSLPVLVVVFVDRSLALIELKQRQRQLKNAGVNFDHVDFAAVADAMGGRGFTARSSDELSAALDTALSASTFSVIAAEIPREAYDGLF